MEPHELEKASLNHRPPLMLFVTGLILLLASAWLLAQQSANAKAVLQKWMLITDEIGSQLPQSVMVLQNAVTAKSEWPLLVFAMIGLVSLVLVLIRRRYSFVAWCVATMLVTAGACVLIQSQLKVADQWLAKEMEVPLPLTVEQLPDSLAIFKDQNQSPEARLLAARTIRTIGLKHAAGLLKIDVAQMRPLIEIAQNETADVGDRFQAAFALFPIDHFGDDACHAIAEAMYAASLSDDVAMRDTAKRYLKLPYLRYEPTITVMPRLELVGAREAIDEAGVAPVYAHAFEVRGGGVFLIHVMSYDDVRERLNDSADLEDVRVVQDYLLLPFPHYESTEASRVGRWPQDSVLFTLQILPAGLMLRVQQTSRFVETDRDSVQTVNSKFAPYFVSWRHPQTLAASESPVRVTDFLAANRLSVPWKAATGGTFAGTLQIPRQLHATEIRNVDQFQAFNGQMVIAVEHLPLNRAGASNELSQRWRQLSQLATDVPQDASIRYQAVWTALLLVQENDVTEEHPKLLTEAQKLLDEAIQLAPANFALLATRRRLTLERLRTTADRLAAVAFCQRLLTQRPNADECEFAVHMLLRKFPVSESITPEAAAAVVAAVETSLKLCGEWAADRRRRIQQWERYLQDERHINGLQILLSDLSS